MKDLGILTPTGGGDPVPLGKERLLIGRRENCDIVLRYPNVSGQHCRLQLEGGYWFVKDLNSRNGTKVNGNRVSRKRLDPGNILAIAKHEYKIEYNPHALGAMGAPPPDDDHMELKRSLMERAGLDRRSAERPSTNRNVIDED